MPRNENDRSMSKEKTKPDKQMANSKFHKLFIDELKDIYWAEKHLVSALRKISQGATSQELKDAIDNHLEETKTHVTRLEEIFDSFGMKAMAKKCYAMEGLIEEGNKILEDTEKDTMVRDAAIIIASQKIEHYEIASYGSLAELANKMGHSDAFDLLEMTLEEEKEADQNLTMIATEFINEEALQE